MFSAAGFSGASVYGFSLGAGLAAACCGWHTKHPPSALQPTIERPSSNARPTPHILCFNMIEPLVIAQTGPCLMRGGTPALFTCVLPPTPESFPQRLTPASRRPALLAGPH